MKDRFVIVDMVSTLRLGKYQPRDGYRLTHSMEDVQVYTNILSARNAVLRASQTFQDAELRVCRLLQGDMTEVLDDKFKRGAKSRPMFIFNREHREDFESVQSCAGFLKVSEEKVYKAIRQGTALEIAGGTYYADYAI